jgi:predicted Zn-dependent protease
MPGQVAGMILRRIRIGMMKRPVLADQPPYSASRRRNGGWPAAAVLLIVSGLVGCQAGTGGKTASQEGSALALGSRVVKPAGGLYKNPNVSRKLSQISDRLADTAGTPPISIRVVNASAPNAVLAPDGNIYLTRELVLLTGDDSELAAVIAHEMAHKLSGHAAARSGAGTQAGVSSADIADLLPDSGKVKALLAEKSERVAALSRQQELEADAMAIRLLAKAGYDPEAVARFLKAMQGNDKAAGRNGYTSYHPASDIRIAQAEKLAAGL